MNWHVKHFDELTTKELYEILRLRAEVFCVEQDCPYQDVDGKDYKSHHLFLEDEGTMLAYCRLIPRGISYEEVSIGRVVTKLTVRRDGYGRLLIKKAIDFIRNEWNEREIRISGQAYLLDFYQSFGFERVSDIYLEDNIEHYEMFYNRP